MTRCGLNRIYYPVTSLGFGRRLGVWFQGCARRCKGCMSPEMQPFCDNPVSMEDVLAHMPDDIRPDGLTVSGGEPFDQSAALCMLIDWFISTHSTDVLIYTGYTIEELRARRDKHTDWILSHIAALADGEYRQEEDPGTGLVGSSNQRVHVFSYQERYADFTRQKRRMQCVGEEEQLFLIGLAASNNER